MKLIDLTTSDQSKSDQKILKIERRISYIFDGGLTMRNIENAGILLFYDYLGGLPCSYILNNHEIMFLKTMF